MNTSASDKEQHHRPYAWPTTLRRPTDVRLVYLDLNHWVTVAKVLAGHPDVDWCRDVVRQLSSSVERGQIVFPISLPIYVEILKIGNRRRRSDLRQAIEHLGRFFVITNRHVIVTHEVEALLDTLAGPNPEPVNPKDYLDWGALRALGMDGSLRVLNARGEEVTSDVRERFADGPDEFDRIVKEAILDLNRQILDGPSAKEEAEFRAQGYRPERVLKPYEDEAAAEHDFARRLDQDSRWRRGRLRDVVSAREVAFHINTILEAAASARGLATLDDIARSAPEPRRVFDAMPSFDVSVSLKTAIHRNPHHRWKNNHVHDINALASTLPYCDVVVTDREMAALVRRTKLDERLDTTVLYRLEDLTGSLCCDIDGE